MTNRENHMMHAQEISTMVERSENGFDTFLNHPDQQLKRILMPAVWVLIRWSLTLSENTVTLLGNYHLIYVY